MLTFETSPEEEFWKVKMERYIQNCSSLSELKEVATLLVKVATTRQVVINGLVKDALDQLDSQASISP
mgnify:FL=1